ncbi:hypothetical protein IFM89_029482 [Coptis chinensis]|uniref:GPI ethanolamine phosphate transferase 1 n=1 Tax=Coptis chinensis TaxID=261450 RepID=A0A835I0N0_9MAGN|nr:hypothetical protein IFM89_029482 [Coptis chinensis]
MLSIFDIYFKTPIVHGMEPVPPRFKPPAKRLVLLIADGLRADKFFEPASSDGKYRAPFLRSVIKDKGRWGVSHARPPTESRPGHVAIIAGFYEDPSAVTKGWKANPVEFDSVFNRSRHTFAFGSPDIIPIFCGALPHSTWNTYPHEYEDFATDASFLDEWSFDQFQSLLNRSNDDPKLKDLLLQDNLVIFLHLLGCDSNGHAHRPYSSIYLNNVKVVDGIAERVYNLVENYFKDNQTAYVFTADHGMSDKGSHGDGHPANTDTPLVAWGAGVQYPKRVLHSSHSNDGFRFVDEHMHDMPTPKDWGLSTTERVDVNQADIAPLMSALLGLPCPVNSVGNLPLGYINLSEAEEVEAVVANTKQVLSQFLRKSQIKRTNSLRFKTFRPLANYYTFLKQIEDLISNGEYKAATELSHTLRQLSMDGLHYFQTYDWLMLMTIVTLGYIGWMTYLVLHVLQSYTSFTGNTYTKTNQVYLCGVTLIGLVSILLFLEHSPPLYHVYTAVTVFLWTQIFSEYPFLKAVWTTLSGSKFEFVVKLLATCAVSILILEFLVYSFTERKLYTLCFLIAGLVAGFYIFYSVPRRSMAPIFVWVSCWILSLFTLMPAEIPDNNLLVGSYANKLVTGYGYCSHGHDVCIVTEYLSCRIASGAMIVLMGIAARWFESNIQGSTFFLSVLKCDKQQPTSPMLFYVQTLLVGLSSAMVWLSTSHRTQNQELLVLHQLINWGIAGDYIPLLPLPPHSPTSGTVRIEGVKESETIVVDGKDSIQYMVKWKSKPILTVGFMRAHGRPHDTFRAANYIPVQENTRPARKKVVTAAQGFSMVLPLFSPTGLMSRLTSIFLGFAPPFLLLSIGYEAVFYGALALVLMAWILFECAIYFNRAKRDSSCVNVKDKIILNHDERCLQLSDMRIPLIFMVLFNVAFFGTGNFASIASFEISSVYRFITVFSPFLMAALLVFKLFIPFMLVICVFSAVTKLIQISRLGCYFLVILCSDVMTIHFFFLFIFQITLESVESVSLALQNVNPRKKVRNTGSWMEIGNTISHFGIVSAQVVFVLLLFALTNIYTKDIQIVSRRSSSLKAM